MAEGAPEHAVRAGDVLDGEQPIEPCGCTGDELDPRLGGDAAHRAQRTVRVREDVQRPLVARLAADEERLDLPAHPREVLGVLPRHARDVEQGARARRDVDDREADLRVGRAGERIGELGRGALRA